MESEEVCLKWNDFSSNITKNLDDLWKNQNYCDVTIYSEGKCTKAHKIILSASSLMFKNIFDVNPCKHPVIILQDIKYNILNALITFIYKGEINIDENLLPDLLKAAQTLQISGLFDSVDSIEKSDNDLSNQEKLKKRKVSDAHSSKDNDIDPLIIDFIPREETVYLPDPPEKNKQDKTKKRRVDCEDNLNNEIDPLIIDFKPEDVYLPNVINNDTIKIESEMEQNKQSSSNFVIQSSSKTVVEETPECVWENTCMNNQSNQNYLCPFCALSYQKTGYRRRHIKQHHPNVDKISCRWCPSKNFSQKLWTEHVISSHNLNQSDVDQALDILNEAIKVLGDY